MYHMYPGYGFGFFEPFEGIIGIILFVFAALVVAAVVKYFYANHTGGCHHTQSETKSALSLLSERYARGEISTDEYKERKAVLSAQ